MKQAVLSIVCIILVLTLASTTSVKAQAVDTTPTLLWNYTLPSYQIYYPLQATNLKPAETYEPIFGTPTIADGVVYVGVNGGPHEGLYAFNASSGAKLWSYANPDTTTYTSGNGVYSTPAALDGVVYMNCNDGNLYALNATNGDRLWNRFIGYFAGGTYSSPTIVNGVVYVGSVNGTVYALYDNNGSELWASTLRERFGLCQPSLMV